MGNQPFDYCDIRILLRLYMVLSLSGATGNGETNSAFR